MEGGCEWVCMHVWRMKEREQVRRQGQRRVIVGITNLPFEGVEQCQESVCTPCEETGEREMRGHVQR